MSRKIMDFGTNKKRNDNKTKKKPKLICLAGVRTRNLYHCSQMTQSRSQSQMHVLICVMLNGMCGNIGKHTHLPTKHVYLIGFFSVIF